MGALLHPAGRFAGAWAAVPAAVVDRMRAGGSWRDDPRCPGFDQLAFVEVDHRTLDGGVARGELVVAREVAAATVRLFGRLFALGFPLRAMRLIDDHGADDARSMAADNSSAFCFRTVDGSDALSWHARGMAIDLNPVENPWVRGDRFVPAEGAPFLDRATIRPGMIVRPGPVTRLFDDEGWEWGGDWRHSSDYHHIVWARR
ncbi:MAG: M15 family metallopeptidase [Kofleriaceae bacterium]|nr:M15 family metallopeptidase [Myxococcales bacterium]MCB9565502.1 M15 family metallopeptidase [Kofleriaceae bacterium]